MRAFNWIVEPGFFSNSPDRIALLVGGSVAVVSAAVGLFTVLREQAFAGEALGNVGATGGSAAYLASVSPLLGFVVVALAGAGVIELIGVRRARARDVSTGIVLGAARGLAALFLYLATTTTDASSAPVTILFGSMFLIGGSPVPTMIGLCVVTLIVVLGLYRMLLLSSLGPELASAKEVPVRLVGIGFLFALALAVALSAMTIGAVLSTALLVAPPAAALRIVRRPGAALALSCGIGLFCTWLGVLLAYDSYYWPPLQHGWPVSFLVVALLFLAYLASLPIGYSRDRRAGRLRSSAEGRR